MKKKILSAIALTMAMTLTLGMTAFAAESPAPEGNVIVADDVTANITTVTDSTEADALDAEAVTLKSALGTIEVDADVHYNAAIELEPGVLKNAKEVANSIAVSTKGSNAVATVIAGADLNILNIPAEGATMTITLPNFTADAAKSYMVLHLAGNVWETLEGTVSGNTVTVFVTSLSPIVIVEVSEKAGTTTTTPSTTTPAAPAAPAAPAESPKTGEALPVAGILALVCLAGVAVSAKKVRYNR